MLRSGLSQKRIALKTAAAVLAFFLCAGCLAGCGGKDDGSGKKYYVPSAVVIEMGQRTYATRYVWNGYVTESYVDGLLTARFVFNGNGSITEKKEYDADGDIRSHWEYIYDAHGNKTEDINKLKSTKANVCEYKYDGSGNITELKRYNTGDNSVRHSIFDGKGNIIRTTTYDATGSVLEISEGSYDGKGNLAKQTIYTADGSTYSIVSRYDARGNEIQRIIFNPDKDPYLEQETKYDGKGNMTEFIKYNPDGTISRRTEYRYDANGNRTELIDYGTDGNIKLRYEYKYDQNGNMTEETQYNKNGEVNGRTVYSDWREATKEQYIFYQDNIYNIPHIYWQWSYGG